MTTKHPARPAFTLIETVISLSIMSILFLGLSGAVMIASNAVPTATQTGLADQQVIDGLNQFRNDLRQATSIQYQSTILGDQLTLNIKDSGAPGTPTRIRYEYTDATNSFTRQVIGQSNQTLFNNVTRFQIQISQENSDATVVWIFLDVDGTIQQLFEIHAALPDKPELI